MAATCFLLLSCLGLAITAQAQPCSRPAAGPNMSLKDSDILTPTFQDGSKVTFVCDVGYTSAGGSGVTTCTAGTWSRVTLKCDRKNCGPAGDVTNGYVDYPEGIEFGDKCVVMCNSGYILVGQNELLCGDQGWMGRMPVCEVVSCDPPAAIQDGTFSAKKDTYDYREAVQYTCNNNYILDGSKYLTCSEDGTFTPAPPKCTMVQCENPNILNAEWTGGSRPPYNYKAAVTYKCKTGYSMTGASSQICDISGQWSPGLPSCQPQPCSRPAAGPNMSLKDSDILTPTFQDGSKVTFVCDVGYTSAGGSGVTTCTAGTWSRVTLKCDTLQDSGAKIYTRTEGENITVACSFLFSGRMRMFCKEECEEKNILVETTDDKAQSGRYSIEYKEGTFPQSYTLVFVSITKLTKSDSGQYRCKLKRSLWLLDSNKDFEIRVQDAPITSL